MDKSLLKIAYSPEGFRKRGHELVDQLADHLDATLNGKSKKVINWNLPEDEYAFWNGFLENGESSQLFTEIVKRTTHVHNPKYIGHQVSPAAPLASLGGLISSLLNNGMAVYEMGMAPSAIERVITEFICSKIGYDEQSRGFLTSGGTLANLTALLTARKVKVEHDIWNDGHQESLGIMVYEEAHYCVDRAARIMGLGDKGVIKIPASSSYNMDVSQLEEHYQKAQKEGIHVFAIVGSAPSTATGMYDDLLAIADFSMKHNLWFHIDGAHGGASIFSPKYKHTVKGIDRADSVVIDGHKMMMMPIITTALLYKNGNHSHSTFSQKADYLLQQSEDEDWYNYAKRTFECTKTMMSIQWFTLLKTYGEGIFNEYVTTLYDLGHQFGELILANPQFELAIKPMSNIVCFRYIDDILNNIELNELNATIRQQLLEEGEYYIVQTKVNGVHYLRTTIMNPFTTSEHLEQLLEIIKGIALTLKS
ncbi:pyridoxal phosphate-dependent decarboxylase family protein [Maribacter sp. HTCC2170]|uniref:pyridoxal phosphate-dependent decarboxylase family protein n=1 Tax=Maribacter sp. (strain HTCC2170 / KCCM 42371) TaxID=313603 RepID=UPI00006B4847|nr:aminotransferase class I/II-fold pyridoxal phosphate-dependent enzyme [Maribacter sp. HTCC2170]EAR01644.1 Bdb protein [Maribacter sp. HTCC2170]